MNSLIGRLCVCYTWALMHHMLAGISASDLGYRPRFRPSEREWLAVARWSAPSALPS